MKNSLLLQRICLSSAAWMWCHVGRAVCPMYRTAYNCLFKAVLRMSCGLLLPAPENWKDICVKCVGLRRRSALRCTAYLGQTCTLRPRSFASAYCYRREFAFAPQPGNNPRSSSLHDGQEGRRDYVFGPGRPHGCRWHRRWSLLPAQMAEGTQGAGGQTSGAGALPAPTHAAMDAAQCRTARHHLPRCIAPALYTLTGTRSQWM